MSSLGTLTPSSGQSQTSMLENNRYVTNRPHAPPNRQLTTRNEHEGILDQPIFCHLSKPNKHLQSPMQINRSSHS